jgi:endoglucanase
MHTSTILPRSLVLAFGGAILLAAGTLSAAERPSPAGTPLAALDKPFTFAYLGWEKKVKIEKGVVWLDAKGLTPNGGAGVMVNLDLSGHADDCPALLVRVGPRNTMKTLNFLLGDSAERTGKWAFPLPKPADKAVLLLPADGAPLSCPNEPGKTGGPALDKIVQWQLIADWSGEGPVDLRVEALRVVKPNEEIRKARAEGAKRLEAARVQAEKDRLAARQRYNKPAPDWPRLEAVYAAGPDVLALQVRQGKLTPCTLSDYKPQPGDVKNKDVHLIRNGRDMGLLVGPPGRESGLVAFEGYSGEPLLLVEADDAANYKIASADDPAFAAGVAPRKIMRKSKADDWQQFVQPGVVVVHRIYLKLPAALRPGKTYSVSLGHVNANPRQTTLRFDPATAWTEAIHVNQAGFRPDDPLKQAFLSVWLGSGGAYDFPAGQVFHLVDAQTGKSVYTGAVGAAWPAGKPEKMADTRNFNGTSVSTLDFSDFRLPGRYRVMVEGLGCSYPFEIAAGAWERAFCVQMKGFYNQRSGIELGPPYTEFVRPLCWKPGVNDCMPITQSTFSIVDGNPNGKGNLADGDTGKPVPEAWGGYHDAGDWNPRRIDHMRTTTFWQLELLLLFPERFQRLKLNIPNDAPGPDLLKECLFELDLFRRLQLPDGGCRYGIETNGDPGGGEVSWKQHMPGYVYAVDILSSYIYAAVAARASQVLESYDRELAATYRTGAVKAMRWAEADRARRKAAGTWEKIPNQREAIYQNRNLAAACLYALTREPHWNEVFLEGTVLRTDGAPAFRGNYAGRDAAFTYARLPDGLGDPTVKRNARHALLADAEGTLVYERNNAFGIASDDPGKPHFIGFYSNPHGAVSLVRAHWLTGETRYLAGAVKACLFPAGANPNNLVYTSGLGTNYAKPMNMDAIATGQKPPIGLTPYGNIDLARWGSGKDSGWITWPITWFMGKNCQPGVFDWPTAEAFFDVRFWPSYCEFCIDQTMGPNAYVWGYLAGRN